MKRGMCDKLQFFHWGVELRGPLPSLAIEYPLANEVRVLPLHTTRPSSLAQSPQTPLNRSHHRVLFLSASILNSSSTPFPPIVRCAYHGPPATRVGNCAAQVHCPSPQGEQCPWRYVEVAWYLEHPRDNALILPTVANRSEIATRIFRTAHELSM